MANKSKKHTQMHAKILVWHGVALNASALSTTKRKRALLCCRTKRPANIFFVNDKLKIAVPQNQIGTHVHPLSCNNTKPRENRAGAKTRHIQQQEDTSKNYLRCCAL